ncbi:hypothetical protein C0Q70_13054 [Pomacea canaliculata]|uniref:Uncharacterized protein n=1 Tax=Pomacea canaliculata TaxID=400727 RepID=A0A2T7NW47_POMCA|nr:hypothetical protein C0Q70_13054 [Pomacea canaliculata]
MFFSADCILGLLRSATSSTVDVGSHEIGLKYCKAMSTWQSTVLEHYDLAVRKRGICHPKAQLSLKPFVVLLFVGSAVRRLRYYSEGEETASVSVLTQGPLPDLVPITYSQFALRERSLSAPDLESQQRQRLTEREVGRELRRISDEFLRTHAFRHVRPGALASIHAELNTVAALFLGGARRLLYRNFAGYFRCVFTWTRRAVLDAERHEADSPVDSPR